MVYIGLYIRHIYLFILACYIIPYIGHMLYYILVTIIQPAYGVYQFDIVGIYSLILAYYIISIYQAYILYFILVITIRGGYMVYICLYQSAYTLVYIDLLYYTLYQPYIYKIYSLALFTLYIRHILRFILTIALNRRCHLSDMYIDRILTRANYIVTSDFQQ